MLALRVAAVEARRREAPVEVVHVVPADDDQEYGRHLLESAVAAVPELRDARRRLLVGEPAPTLVRASRRARMMIVGPRGVSGGSPLGAVAQQLLLRSACPTVFVHETPAGERSSAGTVPTAGALMS